MAAERFIGALRALGASMALGGVLGWLAGLTEATLLSILTARGMGTPLEWLHAVWMGGVLGIIMALAVGAALLVTLESTGFPRHPGRTLTAGVLAGLALIIGGYWFSTWKAVPPLSSSRGALYGAVFALLVITVIGLVSKTLRRLDRHRENALSGLLPHFGGLILLASLMPMWFLPDPLAELDLGLDISASEAGPPVIVIMVDTLRRDHLGCYGYPLPTSPNIDALASESILFTNSSTTGNYTLPSTAALFTGLYPAAHGVTGPGQSLPEKVVSLPEIFKAAGYRTAALVANPLVRADLGFGRGFDHYIPAPPPRWIYHRRTALELIYLRSVSGKNPWRAAEELVPQAIQWLGTTSSKPPFLYLHLIEPHSEYSPPREYALPFFAEEPQSWVGRPPLIDQFRSPEDWQTWDEVEDKPVTSDAYRQELIGLYNGEVRYLDHWVGVFLDSLSTMDLLADSIVVLMADHGEEFDDHGGWVHGNTLYEEMVGMPLLIKLPNGTHGGVRSDLSVDMVDLRATLAGLIGTRAPTDSGTDFSEPLLELGAESNAPIHYYTERPPHLYSLRVGDWKVVRRDRKDDRSWKLYNLADDPEELDNLALERPDQLKILSDSLDEAIRSARSSSSASTAEAPLIDPETERVLEALGYLQ